MIDICDARTQVKACLYLRQMLRTADLRAFKHNEAKTAWSACLSAIADERLLHDAKVLQSRHQVNKEYAECNGSLQWSG